MPTNIASKSLMLNSYRPKSNNKDKLDSAKEKKQQPFNSHHSRKLSIQQPSMTITSGTARRGSQDMIRSSKDKMKPSNNNNVNHTNVGNKK